MSRIDRFRDPEELVDALLTQNVLGSDRDVARALAEAGELVEFQPGSELLVQNATDTDCYFILAGKVDLRINGETLPYGRGAGDLIGEFSAINPRISRTATVIATEEVVALKCTAAALKVAGRSAKELWRLIAVDLTRKIEQRNQLIAMVNERPKIFMIAAESRIEVAEELRLALSKDYDVSFWSEKDLVTPGDIELDVLGRKAREADFGIVFAHPDDLAGPGERMTQDEWETVRFELGYLMAELTRHRTLMMVPAGGDGGTPRLFKGVQPMTYQLPAGGVPLRVALVEAADAIRALIESRKARSRMAPKK